MFSGPKIRINSLEKITAKIFYNIYRPAWTHFGL